MTATLPTHTDQGHPGAHCRNRRRRPAQPSQTPATPSPSRPGHQGDTADKVVCCKCKATPASHASITTAQCQAMTTPFCSLNGQILVKVTAAYKTPLQGMRRLWLAGLEITTNKTGG